MTMSVRGSPRSQVRGSSKRNSSRLQSFEWALRKNVNIRKCSQKPKSRILFPWEPISFLFPEFFHEKSVLRRFHLKSFDKTIFSSFKKDQFPKLSRALTNQFEFKSSEFLHGSRRLIYDKIMDRVIGTETAIVVGRAHLALECAQLFVDDWEFQRAKLKSFWFDSIRARNIYEWKETAGGVRIGNVCDLQVNEPIIIVARCEKCRWTDSEEFLRGVVAGFQSPRWDF